MPSLASSANSSGRRDGLRGSIASSWQAKNQARRRPSLVGRRRRRGARPACGAGSGRASARTSRHSSRVCRMNACQYASTALRRHRDVLAVAARAGHEELAKAALDEVGILGRRAAGYCWRSLRFGSSGRRALADRHSPPRARPRPRAAPRDDEDEEQRAEPAGPKSAAPPAIAPAIVGKPAEHAPASTTGVRAVRAASARQRGRAASPVTRPPARARGGCRSGRRRFPGSRAPASSPRSRWPRRG